jgi:hypothetical protein
MGPINCLFKNCFISINAGQIYKNHQIFVETLGTETKERLNDRQDINPRICGS